MNTVIRSKALRPPNMRQKILLTKNRGGTGSTFMHYQNQCSKKSPNNWAMVPSGSYAQFKSKKGLGSPVEAMSKFINRNLSNMTTRISGINIYLHLTTISEVSF